MAINLFDQIPVSKESSRISPLKYMYVYLVVNNMHIQSINTVCALKTNRNFKNTK